MSDIIQIMPDSLANQIAAGEVIQRPASVVKELVENAIDAGADNITINIKDAGRTLIQVIDNGVGMSTDDARISFERHATSKIKTPEDLFNINTKGFRGEALASIAAVARVELKTKRKTDNIGISLVIQANELLEIEAENTPTGSNFAVKNLFFNVPARRKFLKKDKTEFGHILSEFYRIAIPHNKTGFTLIHNDNTIHKLIPENQKDRILNITDKNINKQLVTVNSDAGFLKITGYVGRPEYATKSSPKQFFFVNNRFMKNGYFHKAVTLGYNNLITDAQKPNYFLFFEIDPANIDINIHPTKTEINFDKANTVFQLIITTIRKALTDFDILPSIDFENTEFVNMPAFDKNTEIKIPNATTNSNYNPFDNDTKEISFHSKISNNIEKNFEHSDNLFSSFDKQKEKQKTKKLLILKRKYLLTPVKSGVMIININRALKQIQFEEIVDKITSQNLSIETIYPLQLSFDSLDAQEFEHIKSELEAIGYRFAKINNTSYNIIATPPYIKLEHSPEIIKNLIKISHLTDIDIKKLDIKEVARQIINISHKDNKNFNLPQEAEELINKLFACKSHQYTYNGKIIINILNLEEIDKLF